MLKFPYGLSNFYTLMKERYVYIDRSGYLPILEDAGRQLLFLRPRRFGKSLLLSMLENYYDVAKANEFQDLFGNLAIGKQPTEWHNQYFVLTWDFSVVNPLGRAQDIQQALHRYLNARIEDFAARYESLLPQDIRITPDAITSFQSLLTAIERTPHKLYLLIDEYDNFANEVLMGSLAQGKHRYEELLYGEGTLKTVFKAIKSAATGRGLDRVFITGVTPIVLHDMTSGYNVAKHISLEPEFQRLCGFDETELVEELIRPVAWGGGFSEEHVTEIQAFMRTVYNGYCFSYKASSLVYNPTLVMYFLDAVQRSCEYPRAILDSNLGMDQRKMAFVSQLPYGEQVVQAAVDEEQPLSLEALSDGFGVNDLLEPEKNMTFTASLLYFLGVLTLGPRNAMGKLVLRVPNLAARKLYFERIQRMILPEADLYEASQAAERFFRSGDLQPVCDFVEQRYFPVLSNRDYRWSNELTLKTAFLTLLFHDTFYMMDSEPELERGYADLVMIVRSDMRQYQLLDMLLEFKYVSLADVKLSGKQAGEMTADEVKMLPLVSQKLAEAAENLQRYRMALETTYSEKLRLHVYVVLALGFERIVWEEK